MSTGGKKRSSDPVPKMSTTTTVTITEDPGVPEAPAEDPNTDLKKQEPKKTAMKDYKKLNFKKTEFEVDEDKIDVVATEGLENSHYHIKFPIGKVSTWELETPYRVYTLEYNHIDGFFDFSAKNRKDPPITPRGDPACGDPDAYIVFVPVVGTKNSEKKSETFETMCVDIVFTPDWHERFTDSESRRDRYISSGTKATDGKEDVEQLSFIRKKATPKSRKGVDQEIFSRLNLNVHETQNHLDFESSKIYSMTDGQMNATTHQEGDEHPARTWLIECSRTKGKDSLHIVIPDSATKTLKMVLMKMGNSLLFSEKAIE